MASACGPSCTQEAEAGESGGEAWGGGAGSDACATRVQPGDRAGLHLKKKKKRC